MCLLCVKTPPSCSALHLYCCVCAASCCGHKPFCISPPNPPQFASGIWEPVLPLRHASLSPWHHILHQMAPAPCSACGQGRLFCFMPFWIADTLRSAPHKETPRTCKSVFALHAYTHFSRLPIKTKLPHLYPTRARQYLHYTCTQQLLFLPLTYARVDVRYRLQRYAFGLHLVAAQPGDPSPLGTWWVVSDLTKVLTPSPLVSWRRRMRPSKRDIT